MKKQKNTLCLFNLIFFLGSFLLVSISSFSNSTSSLDIFTFHHHVSSSKDDGGSGSSQLIIEENENEVEVEGTSVQVYFAFLRDFTPFEITNHFLSFADNFALKTTNPIYLKVHNFRI